MEFEFDDDDEIVATSGAAPVAAPAPTPPAAEAAGPPAPAPTPTAGATAGLLLEFDDEEDEIIAARAPPPPPTAAEAPAADASAAPAADSADAAAAKRPRAADFEAAEKYGGSRAGFVFKMGEQGLGYYADARAAPKKKKKKKGVSFKPTEQKVDGEATVRRLCAIVAGLDTPAAVARKGPKALAMLTTLAAAEGCVTENTAPLFVDVVRGFAASAAMPDGLVAPIASLVEALGRAPRASFALNDRVDVATWRLSCGAARTLRETDDTYDFCAAMKRVSAAIAALRVDASDAAVARRDAVIHCLRAAWPKYEAKLQTWAKTPVEAAVLAAAEKRICFDDAQRDRLDRLTTQVKNNQRGAGRAEKKAYRDEDSTAHPLLHTR